MDANTLEIQTLGRLKKRSEFLFVRDGHYRAQGGLVIQARPNPSHSEIRVGFTATKKIGGAVVRNKAKRRLREVARRVLPEFGVIGTDYVFIARQSTCSRTFSDLVEDGKKALLTLSR